MDTARKRTTRASKNNTEASCYRESFYRETNKLQHAASRSKKKQNKDEIFVCQAGLADIDELNEENLPNTLELSKMTVKCHFCGALGFQSEVNITSDGLYNFGTLCCNKGEIKIRKLPPIAPHLQELFDPRNQDAKYFLPNIRKFNSGMSMASFQCSDVSLKGPGMIRIQGQVQRNIGSLINRRKGQARNIQTYFLDAHLQAEHRAIKAGLISETEKAMAKRIFKILHQALIESNNQFLQDFITIKEWVKKFKMFTLVFMLIRTLKGSIKEDTMHQQLQK